MPRIQVVPLLEIVRETPTTMTYRFRADLGGQPGQFLMVWIPRYDELPMALSHLGAVKGITVRDYGDATHALAAFTAGDRIGVRGPYGNESRAAHEVRDRDLRCLLAGRQTRVCRRIDFHGGGTRGVRGLRPFSPGQERSPHPCVTGSTTRLNVFARWPRQCPMHRWNPSGKRSSIGTCGRIRSSPRTSASTTTIICCRKERTRPRSKNAS